ncbi:MAG TPA: HPr family phosphocarrier protein [Verrucomicrobiae bacterium]|nr:HPr family phosphocarrier protein [Verrucomicrobiae bacterium]
MIAKRPGNNGDNHSARREVVVSNKLGVHARPAAMFVKVANKFESDIIVEKDGEEVNGKSIMGLMMLAAGQDAKLSIIATGRDASVAVTELAALFQRKFDEE